jgi:hypothetical protein
MAKSASCSRVVVFLLLLVSCLLSMPAFGQVFNGTAFQKMPGNWVQVVPLAQVTVCTASGNPCPAATLFTDKTLVTQLGTNIVTADVFGNYTFYATPGVYYVCVAGGTSSRCDFTSTGGGPACSLGTTAVPYFTGALTLCDPNATFDGSGNETAVSVTANTVTAGTLSTTGAGFVYTFKTQTAPANPSSGNMLWYGDSGTNKWTCLNSDGSSCSPGGAAFSGISAGANSNTGTFSASGNIWDFTGVTQFRLRAAAGLTTSADGGIGYDTTNKNWHVWQNGADNFLFPGSAAGTYTDQDCVKLTKTGNIINLADSGGACGASGSASPIMFGSQVGVSLTATQWFSSTGVTTNEAAAQWPVPRAGTVSNLQCRAGGPAQTGSQSDVLTVRKGLASTGTITSSSTVVTCTINSTNPNGCGDGTHNFTVAAGDVLDIQVVPTNSPNPGILNCSAQLL